SYVEYLFFFSSRRRHTRWPRDWSSDVCSSDLGATAATTVCCRKVRSNERADQIRWGSRGPVPPSPCGTHKSPPGCLPRRPSTVRSEERRVGKDCRSRRCASH